jgi:hypothetical protein
VTAAMADGIVKALWRFPVLAMAGERLRSTQIDSRGVAGDRQHYASGPEAPLTAQDIPELADWTAAFPFNPDGTILPDTAPPFPLVTAPDGLRSWRWGDPRLAHALERGLNRPVELVRDLEAASGVVVATVAPERAPAVAGVNVQLRIELPASGWAGRELVFRDGVRLRLVASRADGPGIEARVIEAGRVMVGEPVTLG